MADGRNVTISPILLPFFRAVRNADSFGRSTGIGNMDFTASIAGPKAEQVKRMPAVSPPFPVVPDAYLPRSSKRRYISALRKPTCARSDDREVSRRSKVKASGQLSANALREGATESSSACISAIRIHSFRYRAACFQNRHDALISNSLERQNAIVASFAIYTNSNPLADIRSEPRLTKCTPAPFLTGAKMIKVVTNST